MVRRIGPLIPRRSHRSESLAFISEMKHNVWGTEQRDKTQTVDVLLTSLARQNVGVLMKALQRMEQYWAGVNYVLEILEQKAAGALFLGVVHWRGTHNLTYIL